MTGGRMESTRLRAGIDRTVIAVLAESPTISDALRNLLEAIAQYLNCEFGAIWQTDETNTQLRSFATWESPGSDVEDFRRETNEIQFEPGRGLPGRVWSSREPAWIVDVREDDNFPRASAAARCGIRGAFAFPIRGPDGMEAVAEFFTREPVNRDDSVLQAMETVGLQVGLYLARMRIEARSRWLAAVVESSEDAIVTARFNGEIVSWNRAAEKLYGWRADEIMGGSLWDLMPEGYLEENELLATRVRAGQAIENYETVRKRKDGRLIDVALSISPVLDSHGNVVGTARIARDITARKRKEEQQELLMEELEFLSKASRALEESLDLDETLQTVADLTVPFLGDGCMVDLVDESGAIRRVATATVQRDAQPVLERLQRHNLDPDGKHPIALALKTGQIQVVNEVTDELLAEWAPDEAYLEDVSAWPGRSAVVAPMIARGRTLGAIALAFFSKDRKFTPSDVATIRELARRAAISVDNSRLYAQRSHIAERLQRSLLPPSLPDIPGLEIAAKFRASEGHDVGGDFYDVFETETGDWALAIGDVSGRGADAAAITALARYTTRAAGIRNQRPPAVLRMLNDALLKENLDGRFCTCAYAQLHINDAGVQLQLVSAGHPLPLLLREDGTLDSIGAAGMLLGVEPEIKLEPRLLELHAGDTVVFYTDGLIETRTPHGLLGVEGLAAALEACRGFDAGRIAEHLDQTLLTDQADGQRDDVAILVVQVAGTDAGDELRIPASAAVEA
jgi:PAS domain S-box-containing protein